MLLDTVNVNSTDELNSKLKLLFDSTAIGKEEVSIEKISECHFAIGMELSNVLMRECNTTPQQTWYIILSILRLLPWQVDPENATCHSEDGIATAIYRYFGGLEWTTLDPVFNTIRHMASQGSSWRDIVEYASKELEGKV